MRPASVFVFVFGLWGLLALAGCAGTTPYHKIRFVDADTGRGVPLVELETMNEVRYVSDSAGLVALDEPDLLGTTLYLRAHSHGYEVAPDRYGYRGVRVTLTEGGATEVPLARINIAERLYRVTGEGIYRDSRLLAEPTPMLLFDQPRGGVFGQDSVVNAVLDNQLLWFWGDTERGSYPLGNFEVAGAVSDLPSRGGMDPALGVDLHYFVGTDGFTRPMCPIDGPGPVWIDGLVVLNDSGRERLYCHFARIKDLGTRHEHGIAVWNPVSELFEKHKAFPLDAPLYPHGHPLQVSERDQAFLYFGAPFPHTRVRATEAALLDPAQYEAFTPLLPGSRIEADGRPTLDRADDNSLHWGWKADTPAVSPDEWRRWVDAGYVRAEEGKTDLIDADTGDVIVAHGGSVTWNEHRKRWILIALQQGGRSPLGEVWYAEAARLLGPWSKARRIVTHERYTFYNVKQHPYFARGPFVYFEGTYTTSFSGNDRPTPRYDYNQIMYRLNLNDPRLANLAPTTETPP